MNLLALLAYGLVNVAMVLCHLLKKERIYEFPFWAGALALGWFYPQAIGGYHNAQAYPAQSYASGMFFATLCTLALWGGYCKAVNAVPLKSSWLDAQFDLDRLFQAGAVLCATGFFFHWKLNSLPEEMLAQSQWSGATVKYLFLSSVFVFGFITLWLVYLSQPKLVVPRLLVFIIPSLLLLLESAVLQGRRAAMMNVVAYVLISLWFVRRVIIPQWALIGGLILGLVLINSIGTYRAIMARNDLSWRERFKLAANADYASESESLVKKGGSDFNNYIFLRQVIAEGSQFDLGLKHWNGLVFNYVPAQLVGRKVKNALLLPIMDDSIIIASAHDRYGYEFGTGGVATGYMDAFASFSWFGFIKFWAIGLIMGVLYRHAMTGMFLGQLLYVYMLSGAMHAISHGTHTILVAQWVYFFALGYPLLRWAKLRPS